MSRVLDRELAAVAIRLIVFFLGQGDFFYLSIVNVVWLLILAVAAVVGVYSVFHRKDLYFHCQWPEEYPKVDQ